LSILLSVSHIHFTSRFVSIIISRVVFSCIFISWIIPVIILIIVFAGMVNIFLHYVCLTSFNCVLMRKLRLDYQDHLIMMTAQYNYCLWLIRGESRQFDHQKVRYSGFMPEIPGADE
jgi:hypothetical protein